MLVDIEKFSYEEVRKSLILSKELLRQLSERAPDNRCFKSYTGAYLALTDAINTFTQVQVITAADEYEEEE